jgi:hypothetical protein
MTKVVNLRKEKYDIYIGRSEKGFHYGNPASHLGNSLATVRVKTVEEAVQYHIDWLNGKYLNVEPERREWVLQNIPKLKGKRLGCFCPPSRLCHGYELAKRAEET